MLDENVVSPPVLDRLQDKFIPGRLIEGLPSPSLPPMWSRSFAGSLDPLIISDFDSARQRESDSSICPLGRLDFRQECIDLLIDWMLSVGDQVGDNLTTCLMEINEALQSRSEEPLGKQWIVAIMLRSLWKGVEAHETEFVNAAQKKLLFTYLIALLESEDVEGL